MMIGNGTTTRQRLAVGTGFMFLVTVGSGCGDGDANTAQSPTPQRTPVTAATATRTSVPPTNTPQVAGTQPAGTSTRTPTATATPSGTPVSAAGSYNGSVALDGGRTANLNFTVDVTNHATGTVEIVGPASSTLGFSARAASTVGVSLGFANISGTVDPSSGAFDFHGNISIGGESTAFDFSGEVPLNGSSGSVTATVNNTTYGPYALDTGAGPTPLPTQSGGPSPTPISTSCADGILNLTFADISSDSNLSGASATLGKLSANDNTSGTNHIWVVSASQCVVTLGGVGRALVLSGSGFSVPLQPGSYSINALSASTPPFLGLTYLEQVYNPADLSHNFNHNWQASGGTIVITDGGGGTLQVHGTGIPMTAAQVTNGATGTFTMGLNGTITSIAH